MIASTVSPNMAVANRSHTWSLIPPDFLFDLDTGLSPYFRSQRIAICNCCRFTICLVRLVAPSHEGGRSCFDDSQVQPLRVVQALGCGH